MQAVTGAWYNHMTVFRLQFLDLEHSSTHPVDFKRHESRQSARQALSNDPYMRATQREVNFKRGQPKSGCEKLLNSLTSALLRWRKAR
jgi:hypothetical protein